MREPKRYVNLHAHSNGSIGDAIGLPPDHFDFAQKNELEAHAITDHGNMNTFSHSYKYFENLEKEGKEFKVLYGIEAYFIPSLSEWSSLKEEASKRKEEEKVLKKAKSKPLQKKDENLFIIFDEIEEKRKKEFEEEVKNYELLNKEVLLLKDTEGNVETTVVEDEEETKSAKVRDPLRSRSHLVLLAKNSTGLNSLFKLTSLSYKDGFYFFPRIDFDLLKQNANGNIVATTACLGGEPNKIIIKHYMDLGLSEEDFYNQMSKLMTYKFDIIQKELKHLVDQFIFALGGNKDDFYLEIQFNKLPYQHILNYHLIELSKSSGIKLVATADCHYPNPDHWKERIIYKTLARMTMNKLKEIDASIIPQTIEELEHELYPKNAQQMWAAYKKYCVSEYPEIYKDDYHELVCDAIERTYDIAINLIDKKIKFDKTPKLPSLNKLIPVEKLTKLKSEGYSEDDISFNELVDLVTDGLTSKNKIEDPKYIERASEELDVIRHLKLEKYFLTCAQSLNLIGKKMLLGAGRGCFLPGTKVLTPTFNRRKSIEEFTNTKNEYVYTHDGSIQNVLKCWEHKVENEEVVELEFDDGTCISCTKDHKILTKNRGWVSADDLKNDDEIEKVCH
ncbi:MAG TPA: PHP domain-containing protein [Leptospiraceae bacterium]|nr:PHP domain-containing protein [Leptospiraceae bacterium]